MSTVTQVQTFGEELKKNLQCAICLGLLNSPRSAECLHKFCKTCIETYLTDKKKARCPLCKLYISKRSMRDASELNQIVHKVQKVLSSINTDAKQFAETSEPLIIFSQQWSQAAPKTPVRKTATRKWDADKKKTKKSGCPKQHDEEGKKNLIEALEKGKLGSYKGKKKASKETPQASKEKSGTRRTRSSQIEENVPQEIRTRKPSHEIIEKLKKDRTMTGSSVSTSPVLSLSTSLFNNQNALEAKNRAMERLKAMSLKIESSGKLIKSQPTKPPSKPTKHGFNTPRSTPKPTKHGFNTPSSTPNILLIKKSSPFSIKTPAKPTSTFSSLDSKDSPVGERRSKRAKIRPAIIEDDEDSQQNFLPPAQDSVMIALEDLSTSFDLDQPTVQIINSKLKKRKKIASLEKEELMLNETDKIINIIGKERTETPDIHNDDSPVVPIDVEDVNSNDNEGDDDDLPSCGVFDEMSKESEAVITKDSSFTIPSNDTTDDEAWAREVELRSSVINSETESLAGIEKEGSIPIEPARAKDISIRIVLETPVLKPCFHDEPNFSPITPLTTNPRTPDSDLHCVTPVFKTPVNTIIETPTVNVVVETPLQTEPGEINDTLAVKLLSRKRNKKSFSESESKKQRVLETSQQKVVPDCDTAKEDEFMVSSSTTGPPISSFDGLTNIPSPEAETEVSHVEKFGAAFVDMPSSPVFNRDNPDNPKDTHCSPVFSVGHDADPDNGEDSQDSQNKLSNFVKCIELEKSIEKSSNLSVQCRTVTSRNKTRGTVVEKVYEKTQKTSPKLTIEKDENSINYTIEIENPSSKLTIRQEGPEILSPKLMQSIYDDITNHSLPSLSDSDANQPIIIRDHMIHAEKLAHPSPTEDVPNPYDVQQDGPKIITESASAIPKLSLQESDSLDNCTMDESHFDLVEYKKSFGIQDSNLCDESKLTNLSLLNQEHDIDSVTMVKDSQEDSPIKPRHNPEPKSVEQISPKEDNNAFKSPHCITMITESVQPDMETPSKFKIPLSTSTQHKEHKSDGSETKSSGVTTQDMVRIEKELLGLFSLETRDDSDDLKEKGEEENREDGQYLDKKDEEDISDDVTVIEIIEDTLPQYHTEIPHQNTNITTKQDNIIVSIFPVNETEEHVGENVIENKGDLQHDESATQAELFGCNTPVHEVLSSEGKTKLNEDVLQEAEDYNDNLQHDESSTQVELFDHLTDQGDQLSEVKNISETPISKSVPLSSSLTDAQIQDITIDASADNKENLPSIPLPCLDNNKKTSCSVSLPENSPSTLLVTERSPIIPARRKSRLSRTRPHLSKTINMLLSGGHPSENMKIVYRMYHLMKKGSGISMSIMTAWSDSVTHIVFPHNEHLMCMRTTKYLQGVAAGKWIVSLEWARQCLETKSLISEIPFEMRGDNFDLCSGGPRNSRTSRLLKQPLLFSNLTVFYIGKIKTLPKEVLSQLLEQVGTTITPTQTFGTTQLTNTIKSTPLIDTEWTSVSSVTKEYGEVLTVQWILDCIAAYRVLPIDSSQSSECG